MDRFTKVTDSLYRGSAPNEDDLSVLKHNYNIKKIISLDSEIGDRIHDTCKNLKIKHIIFPLTDGNDPSILLLKEYILPLITNGGPTFIHCKYGKDRTSMAVAMFRVLKGMPVEEALEEAASFGMGEGLPTKDSFYEAVRSLVNDENNSDAVGITRDDLEYNPGINDQSVTNFGQSSFAPFLDVETDHLNRTSASRIFRYCKPNEVLRVKHYWFYSPEKAKQYKKQGDRLFSAELSSGIKNYKYEKADKSNIHYSMVNDADIILYKDYVLMLSPNSLVNIFEEGDMNDVNVGLHDNYTGMAPYSFPGSGGMMESGYGGFAGPVFIPGSY